MPHPARCLALLLLATAPALAGEPLHTRIDALVEARTEWVAPRSSDGELLRRVSLDLVGRVPRVDEVRPFLADDDADKRTKLIDRLLANPEHPRRMQELFHVMLMERRGDDAEWLRFLERAFEANRPWDDIVRTILTPNTKDLPEDDPNRGAAYFLTSRLTKEGAMADVDVPGLTRDVGRLFAGVDLQCAQCHDHLTVDTYLQRDFQGLHFVFENVKLDNGAAPSVTEGLMTTPKEFLSVFDQVPLKTGPVVPGGDEITIPTFEEGEEYAVAPDRKAKIVGVPKFSPLRELATGLTNAGNERFTRNIVNRLWFVTMGRGLVEPLDLQHADNPASHPELLDLLATEFAAHDFDIRWLVRELVLTETYQRSSLIPADREPPDETTYAVAIEKRLSAEQLLRSTLIVTGEFDRLRTTDAGKGKDDDTLLAKDDSVKALKKDWMKAFANRAKEPEIDFEPTVAAALLLQNDERIQKQLTPQPGNLVTRLTAIESNMAVVDDLYLTIFARHPDDAERTALIERLDAASDRTATIGRLAWAMLASTEFVVNH